ncbi:BtrH N-terminal domain-containing protein [Parapedobacter koreensis]|uniref:Butirosin biosynthesis protein H, N-terminal n=1 Tax=Parapedobacter koreensis TaxID=332977 RepID=A0A1H7S9Q1_9SPHI|nr:BtrH N-terminal domain-containing protein [Parapedobacter koreensis]SEL69118.1 Butirosin biosynthesis protein H, N-terminal [Parapedobacter koreensis]
MKIPFEHRQSAHCENGVISNLLNHRGVPISEPLAFGIGSGLFFTYLPFIKVNFAPGFSYRPMPGYIFRKLAKRLGIKVKHQRFSSTEKAKAALDEKLRQGIPVGLQVGVYHLTYFPDEYRFHFNAHNLVVYGKEAGEYLISDPVMDYTTQLSERELEQVRFAKGALAPKGHLYYLERLPDHYDLQRAVKKGIRQTCNDMLAPVPIVGVRAMKWVARNIRKWPKTIGIKKTNHYLGQLVRMQEEIGTGGGGFRFIYAAFLQEAATLLDKPILRQRAAEMTSIGDAWRDFALNISRIYKNRKSGNDRYDQLAEQLTAIAEREKQFFTQLKQDI